MAVNNYVYSPEYPPLMKDGFFNIFDQESLLTGNIKSSTEQPNSAMWNVDDGHDHWQRYKTYPLIRRYQQWELSTKPFHYAVPTAIKVTTTNGYDLTEVTTFAKTLSATVGASGFGMSAEVTATLSLTQEDTESWHTSETVENSVSFDAGTTFCAWTLYDVFEVNEQQWCQYEYRGDDPQGYLAEGGPTRASFRMEIGHYEDANTDPTNQLSANIAS